MLVLVLKAVEKGKAHLPVSHGRQVSQALLSPTKVSVLSLPAEDLPTCAASLCNKAYGVQPQGLLPPKVDGSCIKRH